MISIRLMVILALSVVWSSSIIAGPTVKCGTPEALEAFRQGIKLPRPANGPKYVYSTRFIIHFDTTGTDACTRAYAESVSKYAEYSWAKQVDTLKWAEPPPDGTNGGDSRYDMYVRNIAYLGVTATESSYPTPYLNGYTSYIQVDNNISGWGLLQVTVAHEFNHACQFRYSVAEGTWFMENCATWMEDMCYDNVNDYVGYLNSTPDPLDSTHFAITSNANLYWYAGAIWAMFLQEFYNDSCPRFCWERMGNKVGENTLSGIDSVLITKYSSNLMTALKKYAVWRYFTGTRADPTYHFSESNLWPTSYVLRMHNTYPTSGNESPRAPDGPGGTNFIQFTSGSEVLKIGFDGQDVYNWGAFAIGYRVPSQSIEQEISLNSNWYGTTNITWSGNSHIALIPVVTHWTSSANNLAFTYTCSLKAVTKDVGVTEIQYPIGTIDSTGSVIPRAKVKNFGSDSITFQVTFKIGSTYTSSRTKKLNPGIEDTVNFALWQTRRGTYSMRCSTYVLGDANSSNDTLSGSVTVIVKDVGVTAITEPPDTIDRGSLQPKASVKNYGTQPATFYAFFKIFNTSGTQVYLDSVLVSNLNQNASSTKTFQSFLFQPGKYYLRCSTALSNDNNPLNNIKLDSVVVIYQPSWVLKDSVLAGPKNKYVRSGGSLVAEANKIYALKGNNTREFYMYNINGDSWISLETIPDDPVNRKRVGKGAALAYNKHSSRVDSIYATKGNNTLEFWVYDVGANQWQQKAPVPLIPGSTKKVKGGSGITFLRRGSQHYVYLLKGNNTAEFYAYNCRGDSWIKTLKSAPLGPDSKLYRDGSCIITGPNNRLYVLKGSAKYNEFYFYEVTADTWGTLESLPRPSFSTGTRRNTKVRDGAALCWSGDSFIYAFKGGNTQEFWRYNINQNSWLELDTVPRPWRRKKIGSGAALTFADNKVFALKGNNTREFWQYSPELSLVLPTFSQPVSNLSLNSNQIISDNKAQIIVVPNPIIKQSDIKFNLTQENRVRLNLYNNAGQLVREILDQIIPQDNYSLPLKSEYLPSGIYHLRYEIGNQIQTIKIIVR